MLFSLAEKLVTFDIKQCQSTKSDSFFFLFGIWALSLLSKTYLNFVYLSLFSSFFVYLLPLNMKKCLLFFSKRREKKKIQLIFYISKIEQNNNDNKQTNKQNGRVTQRTEKTVYQCAGELGFKHSKP